MKITNARTMVMGTPWRDLTFLILETDEGLKGVAEARMLNRTSGLLGYLEEALPRYALGQDPFDREKIVHSMYLGDFGRAGEIVMTAIALVEMACWDIVGKALNQPVYRLMGGAVREKIKAYANGWYTVERTPEEFASAAKRVVERGYQAAKLDPFGGGFYELERAEKLRSIALVEAVRSAVGPDFDILIEMHGRFNPATAIEMARELEPFRPGWLEEPVPPGEPQGAEESGRRGAFSGGDRRADPHALRIPRAVRATGLRHHPDGPDALRRTAGVAQAGGLGGVVLRAGSAA